MGVFEDHFVLDLEVLTHQGYPVISQLRLLVNVMPDIMQPGRIGLAGAESHGID